MHCRYVEPAAVALLMVSGAANAQTTTGTTSSGLIYSASNGQITITGNTGVSGTVTIPSTIPGITGTVSSIGSSGI